MYVGPSTPQGLGGFLGLAYYSNVSNLVSGNGTHSSAVEMIFQQLIPNAESCAQLVDSPNALLSFIGESRVCLDVIVEDALAPMYISSVPIMSGLELIVLDLGSIWAELSLSYNHSCQYRMIRDTYRIMWKKFRIVSAYRNCS